MMGVLMEDDVGRLHAAVGYLRTEVGKLSKQFDKVHEIVLAQSEAIRNIDRDLREIKPLTDDYRERRAEWRGAWKFVIALYVSIGGLITLALGKLFDWITTLRH